jgi:hypothetical protein
MKLNTIYALLRLAWDETNSIHVLKQLSNEWT